MDDSNGGTTFSLVCYNNPVLIDKEQPSTSPRPKSAPPSTGSSEVRDETEEILDSILPPREWEEDGKLWRQSVSSTPATRLDVMNLQEQLDLKLQQRQARETGICQVRHNLRNLVFRSVFRPGESCMLSVLMSWSGSPPSTVRRGDSFSSGSGTSLGWLYMHTR